jgi:transposase
MIGIPPGVRILIAMQPVDFRRGADSLAALAREALQQDPFSGTVLVFRARRADRATAPCVTPDRREARRQARYGPVDGRGLACEA